MDKNDESPLKWVLGFATLAFLIVFLWAYLHESSTGRANLSDSNQSFTLFVNASSGGEVIGGGEFTAGSKVSILAEPFIGYTFDGWEGSSMLEESDSDTTFQIFSDMNITARFKEIDSELKLTGNKPRVVFVFNDFYFLFYWSELLF